MRCPRLLIAFAVFCWVLASLPATAQSAATLALLAGKNKQIDQAFIKGDPAPIHDLFSPSATITNPAGGFVSPDELFRVVASGTLKYTSIERSDEKLAQFGNVGILTYLNTEVGTMQGHDISGKTRWTEVWVKQSGEWKIVAVQGTPVGPQP